MRTHVPPPGLDSSGAIRYNEAMNTQTIQEGISYTFGDDAPEQLRGRRCTGGTPATIDGIAVIRFAERIGGKGVCARLEGRPELAAAAAAYIAAQVEARAAAEAERNRPEWVERRRISNLFARAEGLRDYPAEYHLVLQGAQAALAAWRERYPEAAREARRERLLAEARDAEEKATGALTYDADGWLSAEDRQERHDKWMAAAAQLRREADTLNG